MSLKFFITGTDTEVGKTYISVGLLKAFNRMKYSTIGLKPIASGCFRQDNQLYNEDALLLQQSSSLYLNYHEINPFAFEAPIAPNIAALKNGIDLNVRNVSAKIQQAFNIPADIQIIEGVGGWNVPLNEHETMAEIVKHFNLAVILVIPIRLGCINHAILTQRAIYHDKLRLAGWIANFPKSENVLEVNQVINTIKHWIKAPCLGVIPHQMAAEEILDIQQLIK